MDLIRQSRVRTQNETRSATRRTCSSLRYCRVPVYIWLNHNMDGARGHVQLEAAQGDRAVSTNPPTRSAKRFGLHASMKDGEDGHR